MFFALLHFIVDFVNTICMTKIERFCNISICQNFDVYITEFKVALQEISTYKQKFANR